MKHPFLNRNTETYLQEKHWCNVMLMIAALHSTEPVPRPGITLGSLNKSGSIIKTINYSRVFLALTNQKCLLWKRSIRGASQPLFSTNGLQPPCRWSLLIHLLIIMTLVCGFIGSRYMPQCVMSIPACSPNIISLCEGVCMRACYAHITWYHPVSWIGVFPSSLGSSWPVTARLRRAHHCETECGTVILLFPLYSFPYRWKLDWK